jgi:hypothetical protein
MKYLYQHVAVLFPFFLLPLLISSKQRATTPGIISPVSVRNEDFAMPVAIGDPNNGGFLTLIVCLTKLFGIRNKSK